MQVLKQFRSHINNFICVIFLGFAGLVAFVQAYRNLFVHIDVMLLKYVLITFINFDSVDNKFWISISVGKCEKIE